MMCSIEAPVQCQGPMLYYNAPQCISKGDARRRGQGELRILAKDSNGEYYESMIMYACIDKIGT